MLGYKPIEASNETLTLSDPAQRISTDEPIGEQSPDLIVEVWDQASVQAMHVTIRPIGNSKGVILPKPILAQAGLEEAADAELTVENGAIVLRKPSKLVRDGWAEAAEKLAAGGGDELVMGEFGNEGDAELEW